MDLIVVLPRVPASERGAEELHGRHQVEHESRDGHVDKVDIRHGHGDLVGEVHHNQQDVIAQPQGEADQEVDEGKDRQDEAQILGELEVHDGVSLIVKHADPHRWAPTLAKLPQQIHCNRDTS